MIEALLELAQSPLFYVLIPLIVAWAVAYQIGERRSR